MTIWDGAFGQIDIRRVQPYEALKDYQCPGCNRTIPKGMGHYVCVPAEAPDLRRHWQRGGWDNRRQVNPKN